MVLKTIIRLCIFIAFYNISYSFFDNNVKCGIDILVETDFEIIKNQNVALLTNFSGRTRYGELTAEIMASSNVFHLKKIFTPEHGFYSTISAGEHVTDDKIFGIPALSLYGSNRKPTKQQLKDIQVIVIDLQDIGIRSYTYISTMYKVLEAAAENGIKVIICDRPNPLSGTIVDGNVLDKKFESFIGIVPIAYIHGCTIGEIAQMIKGENWIPKAEKLNLTVIKMVNWNRNMTWEETGLIWFPTSPNIPTVNSIRGMAMLGIWGELSIFNIGIGTTLPFQYAGFPDCNTGYIQSKLNLIDKSGVIISNTFYKPVNAKYNQSGFLISFKKNDNFKPFSFGIRFGLLFREAHREMFDSTNISENNRTMFNKAAGTDELFNAIFKKASDEYIMKLAVKGLDSFIELRKKYLFYD